MTQLVDQNLTQERGGDELSLGSSLISSLSGTPCRGGFVTSDGGTPLLRQRVFGIATAG
ncbi:MAG: hypothetical protein OXC93_03580 [Rhodospirillaceae bacterium]|nr:hypothetical protein [Rhodospirillaceae bacterium]